MKKALLGTLVGAAMLAVPALSHADTYQYVNTLGALESETASSPAQALAQPTDKAADSGVILVTTTTGIMTTPVTTTTTTVMPMTNVSGTYTGQYFLPNTSGEEQAGTTTIATSTEYDVSLVFGQNNAATLTTTSNQNGQFTTMVENGAYMMEPNGQVQLTLTGTGTQVYNPAHVIVFSMTGSELQTVQYDSSMYGSSGFMLTQS